MEAAAPPRAVPALPRAVSTYGDVVARTPVSAYDLAAVASTPRAGERCCSGQRLCTRVRGAHARCAAPFQGPRRAHDEARAALAML